MKINLRDNIEIGKKNSTNIFKSSIPVWTYVGQGQWEEFFNPYFR